MWITLMSEKYVIVAGDPIEGFEIIGSFEDWHQAQDYAVNYIVTDSWIMTLKEPNNV